jgi:hypothetical protein
MNLRCVLFLLCRPSLISLRAAVRRAPGVDLIEATVTDLIEDDSSKRRVIGVRASLKGVEGKQSFLASLVIIADGCYSNFRTSVFGAGVKPETKSHFVGTILKDVVLPMPNRGTVALIKGSGPVLMYQISKHDTRILIDVKQPIPSDLKVGLFRLLELPSLHTYQGAHPRQHCPTTAALRPVLPGNRTRHRPPPPNAQLISTFHTPGQLFLQAGSYPHR